MVMTSSPDAHSYLVPAMNLSLAVHVLIITPDVHHTGKQIQCAKIMIMQVQMLWPHSASTKL